MIRLPTRAHRLHSGAVWALLAAYVVFALALAASFPLADPDEGRNAEVMREMLETRDLVIPHLAGMPYLDKPPALAWAGAASLGLFGRSPLAARLPSVIAAFVTLWLLARARDRVGAGERAPATLALTASAPLFLALGSYVIFDMPLTACVTAFWTLLAVELERGVSTRRRIGMFLAIGVGVLIKGPVTFAWVLGGSLAGAVLLRSRDPLRWAGWWPGWLLALGLAGGWFAAALRRHPEYAHYAFVEESLERMTTGSFRREQPFWFAPAVIAGGTLPWSLATPWRRPASRAGRLAAGFVAFAVVFFTLSRSKLVTYLLPAIPAFAWWAAECWTGCRDTRRAGALLTAFLLLSGAGMGFVGLRGAGSELLSGSLLAGALIMGAIATTLLLPLALAAAWLTRPRLALAVSCAWAPAVLLLAGAPLAGYVRGMSGAPLAEALRQAGARAVIYVNCYSPGTDFLLGRRGTIVSATGQEITSNYVARYRDPLRARGLWTLVDPSAPLPPADAIVRPSHDAHSGFPPPFHVDRRFAAWPAPGAVPATR